MVLLAYYENVVEQLLKKKLLSICSPTGCTKKLHYAHALFATLPNPTLFLFNTLIRVFSYSQSPSTAFSLYSAAINRHGLAPDHFTFPSILKSCAVLSSLRSGCCVHSRVVRTGHEANLYVSSTLIHMYMSCADSGSAEAVFSKVATEARNIVVWSTMIGGYAQNGREADAIALFRRMVDACAEPPNEIAVVSVLASCGRALDLDSGRWVHDNLIRCWTHLKGNVVIDTAVVDMYGKCGSLEIARELFDRMGVRNEFSWNAMINAYNQYEKYTESIHLFANMMSGEEVRPDTVTILGMLGASAGKSCCRLGREIHGYLERNFKPSSAKDSTCIYTSVIDMYCKTGNARSALKAFTRCLPNRDVLAWTTMIMGLANHGHGRWAVELFREMERDSSVVPDHIVFIGVLTACRHAGLVDEGIHLFGVMRNVYGLEPEAEHYGCMMNLLCRGGRFEEAERLLAEMPFRRSAEIWGSVLSGCGMHGNYELAEKVKAEMKEFGGVRSGGVYVLLSNVYASGGKWEGVKKARQLMQQKGIEKTPGFSSTIQVF